ncbi:hypothetical protein ACFWAY_45895 [Rhodococcus sp. NPDC059968]
MSTEEIKARLEAMFVPDTADPGAVIGQAPQGLGLIAVHPATAVAEKNSR